MASSAILVNHVNVSVPVNSAMITVQAPSQAANFLVAADQTHVKNYARSGNDLIIEFDDGKELRIESFFAHGLDYNLVFTHDNGQWLTVFDKALGGDDGIVDPLVDYEKLHDSSAALLGILGAAGALALEALSHESSQVAPPPAPLATPAAPTTYADNVGSIQGAALPASQYPYTDDATPGINVGAGLTNTPKLYVDGQPVAATYDPVAGTLTPNAPLPEGNHQITYAITGPSGNESTPSGPISITVDTTPPATPVAPTSYDDMSAQFKIRIVQRQRPTTRHLASTSAPV